MKRFIIIKFLILTVFTQNIIAENKLKLSDFSFNKFSQFGEDGVIQKIFEILGTTSKLCLEVGAGDGPGGSNIAHLWKNLGWKAILIEGHPEQFKTLEASVKEYDNCKLVKSYIEKDEKLGNTIDSIVASLDIKENIDLLSLDIDGNDYYIFESLKIHPRVIIVEFNHTIPYYRDIYQQYTDHSWEIGCSVASLKRIGKQKNYELIAITLANAFFVDANDFDKFKEYETSLERIFKTDYLKNIILTFSGDPIVVAKINNLSNGFFKVGYPKKMFCHDCYDLRINEIDLNEADLNENFPGFPKTKPQQNLAPTLNRE